MEEGLCGATCMFTMNSRCGEVLWALLMTATEVRVEEDDSIKNTAFFQSALARCWKCKACVWQLLCGSQAGIQHPRL